MIIFKIALIILVALPVVYFAWRSFSQVNKYVRDVNKQEKAERQRKIAAEAEARASASFQADSRFATSVRSRYDDPTYTQPMNEYVDPRYTQQWQDGYTQQMNAPAYTTYGEDGIYDNVNAGTRYTETVQRAYTQPLPLNETRYTQKMSGYIDPMEEDFEPAPTQAYEDQYVEPVKPARKKTTRRRKNGRR